MRYIVHEPWPAKGGDYLVPAGTVIDDAVDASFKGVVPMWNVTPLDEATRSWLVAAYQFHPGITIPPVGAE